MRKVIINYSYDSPWDLESETYFSIEEFLEKHPTYTWLLSEGREEHNMTFTLYVPDDPFTEKVTIKHFRE